MNSDTFLLQRRLMDLTIGCSVNLEPREYIISNTLVLDFTTSISDVWLFGNGAILRSAITDGSPVLRISVSSPDTWVRRLNFLDFTIFGNGKEGHGIQIMATGVGGQGNAVFHLAMERIAVEGVGGDGFNVIGAIFESEFCSCAAESCGGNGVTMGNTADGKGILSAMRWHGGGRSIRNNVLDGFGTINGAYDIHLSDTYFLLNGGLGCSLSNGIRKMSDCGFENNQRLASNGGPALWGQSFGAFDGCAATPPAAGSKQSHLMDFYIGQDCPLSLRDCAGGGVVTGDTAKIFSENLQGVWTAAGKPL